RYVSDERACPEEQGGGRPEVAAYPVPQPPRLADVQDLAIPCPKEVHARSRRKIRDGIGAVPAIRRRRAPRGSRHQTAARAGLATAARADRAARTRLASAGSTSA